VYAYVGFDAPGTPRETADRLADERENWVERRRGMYAIRPRDGGDAGELAGEAMLATGWDHGAAWFGLILGKRFRGRGYAGERADAMLELAFDRFDLEYVAVTHEVGNENSRRAVERYVEDHGGRHEATLRQWSSPGSGAVPDEAYYAVRGRHRGPTGGSEGRDGESTGGHKALPGRLAVIERRHTMSVSAGGRRIPVGVGAAAGAVAWLLGYLLTYVVTSGRIREFRGSFLGQVADLLGLEVPTWKVVGWVFYNAHFVDTAAGGGTGSAIGGDGGFTALLYVVPPLVLLAAGLAAGRAAGNGDPASSAVGGASVLIGYLPLSVLGVFLFETSVAGTAVGPRLGAGILLAGVLYPAVFGAVGAGIAVLATDDGGGSSAPQL
jgi:RimJ/RimL family protein N-acetyltransferase